VRVWSKDGAEVAGRFSKILTHHKGNTPTGARPAAWPPLTTSPLRAPRSGALPPSLFPARYAHGFCDAPCGRGGRAGALCLRARNEGMESHRRARERKRRADSLTPILPYSHLQKTQARRPAQRPRQALSVRAVAVPGGRRAQVAAAAASASPPALASARAPSAAPAARAKVVAPAPQAVDLEDILKERDACGVSDLTSWWWWTGGRQGLMGGGERRGRQLGTAWGGERAAAASEGEAPWPPPSP
jgi:hypothetical protein